LKPALKDFVIGNPFYRWYFVRLNGEKSLPEGQTIADVHKRFLKRILLDDHDLNSFMINKTVTHTRSTKDTQVEDVIQLKVEAGDFSSINIELKEMVEKFWNHGSKSVSIEWVEKESSSSFEKDGIFSFLLNLEVGRRSWVNTGTGTVNLVQPTRIGSIAHEFGHVLGFVDNYHTTWNAQTCKYSFESLPSDIMSESFGGKVSDTHWKELEERYPVVTP